MLIADNLAIARGGRRLAEGICFAVAPGDALVVTGRNGTGKSTLLRVAAGLLMPVAGRVRWQASNGEDDDAGLGVRVHYLGHADSMKGALSALENLAFWQAMLSVAGAPAALSPQQALERFDLARIADLPVSYLSAGQKRRVALARLLVAWRPVWLVDEPTTALDTAAQARFADVMHVYLASGGSIIAATHAALGLETARELSLGGTR